jgi:KRAB domain-containing zinc finger protein
MNIQLDHCYTLKQTKYIEDCRRNGVRVLVDANTGKTPYNCVICDLGFFQRSKLYEHKRTTHGGHVSCLKCNKVLSSLRVLKRHMKNLCEAPHSKSVGNVCKPYKCSLCGKGFTHMSARHVHEQTHVSRKSFRCSICNKRFSDHRNVLKHMNIHKDDKLFSCKICGESFSLHDDLALHIQTHSGEHATRYICNICGEGFSQCYLLDEHFTSHTKRNVFECETCNKTFSRKEQLDNHVVTHLETKPFSCGECQKQFKFISDLRDHFKTHLEMYTNTTSTLLECEICFKLLANKISLQNHMKIHTGDYPFICKFCGKGCLHHTSHRLHENTHIKERDNCVFMNM